ncbi:MAG: hypothetical protein QG637_1903 [Chloroflexota bacterium]|nr:hypothetical protein [Chloroflexota bacterium]
MRSAMHNATYRFFDAAFTVETDDFGFLARFDRAYRRFRAAADPGAPVYRVRLRGRPELDLNGDVWRAADPATLSLFACNAILNAATSRVCSHVQYHAAALAAPDGAGVVLAGDAGLGKTTLTLALLRHGFRVFSDDVAAVGCADGLLHPFPRPLAVRDAAYSPDEKRLLDATEPALAQTPSPPRLLILLTEEAGQLRPSGRLMALDRITAMFLTELTELPRVQAAIIGRTGPYPTVTLDLVDETLPTLDPAILALCRRHAILPFDIGPGPARALDFGRSPRLVHLSAAEATERLLRHLKGGSASALLAERFGGRPAGLFMALAALTDRMTCYRLEVGQLEASVGLILAVGADGHPPRHFAPAPGAGA